MTNEWEDFKAAFSQTAGYLKIGEVLIHEGLTQEKYKDLHTRLRSDHGDNLDIMAPEQKDDTDTWVLKVRGHRVEL